MQLFWHVQHLLHSCCFSSRRVASCNVLFSALVSLIGLRSDIVAVHDVHAHMFNLSHPRLPPPAIFAIITYWFCKVPMCLSSICVEPRCFTDHGSHCDILFDVHFGVSQTSTGKLLYFWFLTIVCLHRCLPGKLFILHARQLRDLCKTSFNHNRISWQGPRPPPVQINWFS